MGIGEIVRIDWRFADVCVGVARRTVEIGVVGVEGLYASAEAFGADEPPDCLCLISERCFNITMTGVS